jgi:hypothetical protein
MTETSVNEKRIMTLEKHELDEIKKFTNNYNDINHRMGELSLNEIVLSEELEKNKKTKDELVAKYKELRTSEIKFANELKTKYGEGQINLESGTFHPG